MEYILNLRDLPKKHISDLDENFRGTAPDGREISFTSYYMQMNGKPFFGISGEFHYSRCDAERWETEILKMKSGGINIISTYVFWIHHEEEEGIFDFSGRKDVRRFVKLCAKHGMYVILRIGPFDHGEVRNGGLPDWLYGKPFEMRKLSEGYLFYVRRLYRKIGEQVRGLMFRDGGPVIAAQIDNEYMHASAAWENTTGISNEWIFSGDEGDEYLLTLRDLAKDAGIVTPFYTCTGWGGAPVPDSMMPLWGGYSYRPWLFYYSQREEHPMTEEYIYQDFHRNGLELNYDFHPGYAPEDRPYACCEMGGGMFCTYNYRFALPYRAIDAMANIKLASGCNFLGYYMYQGGTNPRGKHGTFMNEAQAPKMSYDYQAALGEFGQPRESYHRLRTIHLFLKNFGADLCRLQTALPEGALQIDPGDLDTLRFAARTDGRRGYLFLNNFQDHAECREKTGEQVRILTSVPQEDIEFTSLSLAPEENCILPFHMDIAGIDLIWASAQPVTVTERNGRKVYVFLKPEGMRSRFVWEGGVHVLRDNADICGSDSVYLCGNDAAELFTIEHGNKIADILCLNREMVNRMYQLSDGTLIFSDAVVTEDPDGIILESRKAENILWTFPAGRSYFFEDKNIVHPLSLSESVKDSCPVLRLTSEYDFMDHWKVTVPEKNIPCTITPVSSGKYQVELPDHFLEGIWDAVMEIRYIGDIGHAFIDGTMIHDNFCSGEVWELGLREYADSLAMKPLTIGITPLRQDMKVNVESSMAARFVDVTDQKAELLSADVTPVYQFLIRR